VGWIVVVVVRQQEKAEDKALEAVQRIAHGLTGEELAVLTSAVSGEARNGDVGKARRVVCSQAHLLEDPELIALWEVLAPKAPMPLPNNRRKLLGEHDAAEYLCLSVRTLQKWRVDGGGPVFVKTGRSVRYEIADLDDWVDQRRFRSTSEVSVRLQET